MVRQKHSLNDLSIHLTEHCFDKLHVSNMNWLEISVKAIVPLSRIPPVGPCCQKQKFLAGISKILHRSVFCEMQLPILTGDNRLRQQSLHILDNKCGVFMPEKNTNSVKIEQKCNNKKRRSAIEHLTLMSI